MTKEEKQKLRHKEWLDKHPGYHRIWYEKHKDARKKYNHDYWAKWYEKNKLRKLTQNLEYREWCKQHE